MKKKVYLTLLSIFIIVITASSSYAYFNSKLDIKGSNGNNLNVLNIQNGNEKITIDTSSSKWEYNNGEVIDDKISNPTSGAIATYSGVKVSNESNLTSNVELEFAFKSLKDGGTKEDNNIVPPEDSEKDDKREPAKNFEVWVGDIDNLNVEGGYGQGSVKLDKEYIFLGKLPNTNTLDVYPYISENGSDRNAPEKYDGTDSNGVKTSDAPGTDRRMVTSGFYNFYKNLLGESSEFKEKQIKIYFETANGYPKIHYWNDSGFTTTWPGNEMKYEEDNLYSYIITGKEKIKVLLTLNGIKQSSEMELIEGEWLYKWGKLYKISNIVKNTDNINFYSFRRTNNYQNNNNPLQREVMAFNAADFYSFTYNKYEVNDNGYSSDKSLFKNNLIGPLFTDNGEVFYDGYTDRAIRKKMQDGEQDNENNYIQNGVNWSELQPAEPITFMYQGKIGDFNGTSKKVNSATIQIMLNDIQPEPSKQKWSERWNNGDWNTRFQEWTTGSKNIEWQTSFSAKSNVNYQVTLKVKGSDMEAIRVAEWENIINNLDQHGPKANLVTLQVPQRLLYLIEEGEKDGLELLIDDPRDGSTINKVTGKPEVAGGDSYCIDFARLLVNDTIPDTKTIKGQVIDATTKNGIQGVKVNSGNNENIVTNSNGEFTISVIPGQIVLNFSHPNYEERNYTIYNLEKDDNKDINIKVFMTSKSNAVIIPKIKFEGTLVIRKYKKHSHTNDCNKDCNTEDTLIKIDGEDYKEYKFNLGEAGVQDEKTEVFTELKIDPGNYYILDYSLKLFDSEHIDELNRNFTLTFKSDIKAKITQENNHGWEENYN